MRGDLPPASITTCLSEAPAEAAIFLPMSELPVKATAATSRCSTNAAPTSAPPFTTLTMPAGIPASDASRASSSAVTGVCGEGLMTTALPAASAGATFQLVSEKGPLNGARIATTPYGRRIVRACRVAESSTLEPWTLSAAPA